MRICQSLTCDNAADLWWHGPWCASCADKEYGRVPMWVGQMESRVLPVNPRDAAGRDASSAAGPPAGAEAPAHIRTEDEFLDLLDSKGWDLVDLEFVLVQALEELS